MTTPETPASPLFKPLEIPPQPYPTKIVFDRYGLVWHLSDGSEFLLTEYEGYPTAHGSIFSTAHCPATLEPLGKLTTALVVGISRGLARAGVKGAPPPVLSAYEFHHGYRQQATEAFREWVRSRGEVELPSNRPDTKPHEFMVSIDWWVRKAELAQQQHSAQRSAEYWEAEREQY